MTWETVIGLETHAELATSTKIFCSCTTRVRGRRPTPTAARSALECPGPCRW